MSAIGSSDRGNEDLKERVNAGVRRAADVLSATLRASVRLEVLLVELFSGPDLERKARELQMEALCGVQLAFKGPLSGVALLLLPLADAVQLVVALTDDQPGTSELDSIRIATLVELGSVVLNGVMGVIGSGFEPRVRYALPVYLEDPVEALLTSRGPARDVTAVGVKTRCTIEQHRTTGEILLLFDAGSVESLWTVTGREVGVDLEPG